MSQSHTPTVAKREILARLLARHYTDVVEGYAARLRAEGLALHDDYLDRGLAVVRDAISTSDMLAPEDGNSFMYTTMATTLVYTVEEPSDE